MNKDSFFINTKRYILEGGEDLDMEVDTNIDTFDIIKFDYKKIFNKYADQTVSYREILHKMFEIENELDLDMDHVRSHYKNHPDEWKELFIFFCVMPFIEYEFQGSDGSLLNPDTLHKTGLSQATENNLIGTFSDIEFESLNQEIPDDRLADKLQCVLRTDLFSNSFSEDQRKRVITNLLLVGFQSKYRLVTNIGYNAESTYKNNFMNFLFRPICEYVASILRFQPQVEEENAIGLTGVHTRIPHQSNDLFYSYPDMVAYAEKVHYQSLALVEVKKLPILKGRKILHFTDLKIKRFLKQVIAEMFSNHTNKGILTDSYTTILVEVDIKRNLEIINENKDYRSDDKRIALNYKLLDCQSSGITLRGGIISYLYEAFLVDEFRQSEIKRGMDAIYKFIRKTDEEYLTYLDDLASKNKIPFMEYCINAIGNLREPESERLLITEIGLGKFDDIDVQSGFTFNTQLFKVRTKNVSEFVRDVNDHNQFIVKSLILLKRKEIIRITKINKLIFSGHVAGRTCARNLHTKN